MSRFHQSLAVCSLAMFGLWGCARGPGSSQGDSTKSSEEKIAKLEDELCITLASKEQYRKRLDATEAALTQTQQKFKQESEKLTTALKEQEELKTALKQRIAERDHLQTQYDGFRKGLRDLLTQSEATAPLKTQPTTTALSTDAPKPREIPTPSSSSSDEAMGPALQ